MSVLFSLVFSVSLDGKPIGEHRFTLVQRGEARELTSEASFRVRVLGIPAYRYSHRAVELWQGDCLQSLASKTDDDGKEYAVDWNAAGGCTMSFAYWNPRILKQRALLNAQTGELEPIVVDDLGGERYRLQGRKLAIELQYEGGKWVGLETRTDGGRRLSYRLVPNVNLSRFMGDWYVIANIPTFLEKGAHNAVESYRLTPDGRIATTFTFRQDGFDGEQKRYTPTGFVVDRETNAVWGMQFIWPIKADYRISHVAEDYSTTVITRQQRDYAWIMARTPSIPEPSYRRLVGLLAELGYDISKVEKVPQRWN